MKLLDELPQETPRQNTILTVGVFDGLHLGHRHLLRHLKEAARRCRCLSGVVTFRNHPRMVLRSESEVRYLTSTQERLSLLKEEGLDLVVPVTFDAQLSRLRAREFVSILMERLGMRGLVMGPTFTLGHQREGDPATLKRLGQEMGFEVQVVEPLTSSSSIVSSTAIRKALVKGEVERAAQMLGRNYSLEGRVARGEGRGRSLGFPTANLEVESMRVIPADGIYATWTYVNGNRFQSATNIGVRPTFGAVSHTVETFIMDFDEELYGRTLRLEFARRLRDEVRFHSPGELVTQLHKDVEAARQALEAAAQS